MERLLQHRAAKFIIQAALLAAVFWLGAAIISNTAQNLERFNFRFDLGFLQRPAGFSIIQTLIPYSEASSYGRVFLVGLLNTLVAAALGILFATSIGFALGAARLSGNPLVRGLAVAYVGLFRNLPLLLVLFFLYFGVLRQLPPPRTGLELGDIYLNNRGLFLPSPVIDAAAMWLGGLCVLAVLAGLTTSGRPRSAFLTGAIALAALFILRLAAGEWDVPQARGLSISGGARLIPELLALVAALSLYSAAYIAEIVRAGIESVPRAQWEAAASLGFSERQTLWLIIMPQAMRLIIPPLTNQYLTLTKNSSLAVAIGYPDLVAVFAGTALAQTGQAVEIMAMTLAVYLLLSLATAAVLNRWNRVRWT